ncbi:MAG: Uncharacterized conserved protein UCP005852, methanogenesis [Candidatus Syntrophoarchaeum caldarius]|uniref:Uncharacterized conserved protein UCP005852, methanogenesis n=1 Tax=Candidatus Syntropharchaeum caldarium TaxID=1838285 RepID=A0A1F2PBH1_9EURY|nr:MAG: Uncharacterized conserved protein UCP005852, methanogenesis [Candidatus Syntrophoarchaeum caldarius]
MKEIRLKVISENEASDYIYVVADRTLKVEEINDTYVKIVGSADFYGNGDDPTGFRSSNTVTVRNTGNGIGNVYIYRRNVLPSRSHDVVGILENTEVLEGLKASDEVMLSVEPPRIMAIGMQQEEAYRMLSARGIHQIREGAIEDDAIIVEQNPVYTISILKTGEVRTYGISSDKILRIKLCENIDQTLHYFRYATFMRAGVGKLSVKKKYRAFVLFDERAGYKRSIMPENTPDVMESFTIGVTNMAKEGAGTIGIRLKPSEKYGPTGENFKASNIVGTVTENRELLNDLKTGDTIYFSSETV